MLYTELLTQERACPFCDPAKERMLIEKESAYLTYALAPYHKHHLLVIPKRHIEDFTELSQDEWNSVQDLLAKGSKTLKELGYKNYSILVRNGDETEKSIAHTHFHIVPNVRLGDLDLHGNERRVLEESEIDELVEEIKTELLK